MLVRLMLASRKYVTARFSVVLARFQSTSSSDVVTLDYKDLVAGADLSVQIERAYSFDGNGPVMIDDEISSCLASFTPVHANYIVCYPFDFPYDPS